MVRAPKDDLTLDLLSWQPPKVTVGFDDPTPQFATLRNRIAIAIAKTLRSTEADRSKVAKQMSEYLGDKVTKNMLDAYASEGRSDHRITLERFIALIHVTDCHEALGFVPELFGYAVVPTKYADIIELHLIEEHERKIASRKATLEARFRGGRR